MADSSGGTEGADQTRPFGSAGQASAVWAAPDDPAGPASVARPTRKRGGRHRPAWLPLLLVLLVVLAVAAPVALLSLDPPSDLWGS